MLNIIFTAVNAIAPIIALITLGYLLKQMGFLTDDFDRTANQLVFHVGLPAMLFINVYDIEAISNIRWDMAAYCVGASLVIFALGYVTAVAVTPVPQRRGVVLQCTFRSNFAIIGLPMASALGGAGALMAAAIISAISIPVFNILAVISLTVFVGSSGKQGRIKQVLWGIATNSLTHGVVLGIVALLLREAQLRLFSTVVFSLERDLKLVYTTLSYLKAMTTPLALIVLGSQFRFSAARGMGREIVVGTLWRTVLAPLIGIGGAVLLSRQGILSCGVNEYPALVALFGSPVAVSSAVMAESMGNDSQLAAQLVVWTSLVSMVTVFVITCILLAGGYIAL